MRRLALLCSAFCLLACAKTENANPDSVAAAAAAAAMPAPITLAEVAGTWTVRVMPETGDSTLLTYELTATADTSGWSIKMPDRAKPVPVSMIRTDADSLMTAAGPYPSALRKGTKVTTESVVRLQDGKLVGRSIAHYSVKTADSVRVVRTEGTRKP
ncbi:MAG: hypothetical protein ABI877_14860 [Gemmatimonadaceae bacterium]